MTDVTNTMLPLNALGVEAQIGRWIATGLPTGFIRVDAGFGRVSLKVENALAVAIWAIALTEPVGFNDATASVAAYPTALRGWRLRVWCDAPVVRAEQMIECSEVTA